MSKFQANALTAADAIISPQRAAQLDLKYDDGSPSTGSIRTGGVSATATDTDCGKEADDGLYAAGVTATACILLFQVN